MTRTLLRALGLAGFLAVPGLVWAHGGPHPLQGEVSPSEAAAFALARPALEKHCFRCHSTAGGKGKRKALVHLDMTRYPFGGHHAAEAGAVVRAALGAGPDGARATMPKEEPGRVSGEALARILKWADAFAAAHPVRAKHEH